MAKQGSLPTGMAPAGLGELWSRIKFVLLAIVVYRIGAHIPVPGINPDRLAALFDQNQGTILSLFNMFSGGALERMSIFALGIMPYISASIIMQLLTAVSPQLEALKKRARLAVVKSVNIRVTVRWFWPPSKPSVFPQAWLAKVLRSLQTLCTTSQQYPPLCVVRYS